MGRSESEVATSKYEPVLAGLAEKRGFVTRLIGDFLPTAPPTTEMRRQANRFSEACCFLKEVLPQFIALEAADVPMLAQRCDVGHHVPGVAIMRQGEPCKERRLFVVFRGTCELRVVAGGQEHVMELRPGDYFGEDQLLYYRSKANAECTVVAGEKCVTLSWTIRMLCALKLKSHLRFARRGAVCVAQAMLREAEGRTAPLQDAELAKLVEVLDHVPLLSPLPKETKRLLARASGTQHFLPRQALATQGDTGPVFVLTSGEASCVAVTAAGETARTLRPGQTFGAAALLDGAAQDATVVALTDVSVLVLDRETLEPLLGPLEQLIRQEATPELLEPKRSGSSKGSWAASWRSPMILARSPLTLPRSPAALGRSPRAGARSPATTDAPKGLRARLAQALCFSKQAVARDAEEPNSSKRISRAGSQRIEYSIQKVEAPKSRSCDLPRLLTPKSPQVAEKLSQCSFRSDSTTTGTPNHSFKFGLPRLVKSKEVGEPAPARPVSYWQPTVQSLEQLERVRLCGRGGFGYVHEVKCTETGRTFALKACAKETLIKKGHHFEACLEKEIQTMVDSPFFVKLHATFQDPSFLYYVLELCPGGELEQRMNAVYALEDVERCPLLPKVAQFFTGCMALAIEHLHQRKVVYRDLKPANVILDAKGYGKLCDMGTAKFIAGKTYTMIGSPMFMAPELTHMNKPHDLAVDWWALGINVYTLLRKQTPHEVRRCRNVDEVFHVTRSGFAHFDKSWPDMLIGHSGGNTKAGSEAWKAGLEVVEKLCKIDPQLRLPVLKPKQGPAGLAQLKALRFFDGLDWHALASRTMPSPLPAQAPAAQKDLTKDEQEFAAIAPVDLQAHGLDKDPFEGF